MSSGKDYASLNQRHFEYVGAHRIQQNRLMVHLCALFFSSHAASYDEKPWIRKLNQWLADQIEQRKEWIGLPLKADKVGEGSDTEDDNSNNSNKEFKVLDYAAGTGNVSQVGLNI